MTLPLHAEISTRNNKVYYTLKEYNDSATVRGLLHLPSTIHPHVWSDIIIPTCLSEFITNGCNGGGGDLTLAFDTEQQKSDLIDLYNNQGLKTINGQNPIDHNFDISVVSPEPFITIDSTNELNTVILDTIDFDSIVKDLNDNYQNLVELVSGGLPLSEIRGTALTPYIHNNDVTIVFTGSPNEMSISDVSPGDISILHQLEEHISNYSDIYNSLDGTFIPYLSAYKIVSDTNPIGVNVGTYEPYGTSNIYNLFAVNNRVGHGPFFIDHDVKSTSDIYLRFKVTVNGNDINPVKFNFQYRIYPLEIGVNFNTTLLSTDDVFTPSLGIPSQYTRTILLPFASDFNSSRYAVYIRVQRLTNGATNNASPIYLNSVSILYEPVRLY
jgi:hypothetical protein